MSPSLVVRSTAPADQPWVLELVRAAFSDDIRTGEEEVDIVVNTWALGDSVLPIDLVALDGDTIAGHVLGARGTVGDNEVIAVAPLAVAPSHQGHRIGTTLMRTILERADEANWPLAVLLGRPEYYIRFGFEPASQLGIAYAPVGEGNPNFQARRLRAFTHPSPGLFTYCWERP